MADKPILPDKNYVEIRQDNKDNLFIIREKNSRINVLMCYNSVSNTYMGLQFKFFDDNWSFIAANMEWLRYMVCADIRETLKEQGYVQVQPTRLESIIWSGHPLLSTE
jgi:hypothetical protein